VTEQETDNKIRAEQDTVIMVPGENDLDLQTKRLIEWLNKRLSVLWKTYGNLNNREWYTYCTCSVLAEQKIVNLAYQKIDTCQTIIMWLKNVHTAQYMMLGWFNKTNSGGWTRVVTVLLNKIQVVWLKKRSLVDWTKVYIRLPASINQILYNKTEQETEYDGG